MPDVAQLVIKIQADAAQAKSALSQTDDEVKDKASSWKEKFASAFTVAGGLAIFSTVTGAIGMVQGALSDFVNAGMQANTMDALLAQGLKSTHDASGMTTDSLNALADSIMGQTGISDIAVKGAEQMLLTFTGLGKNAFPAATQAVADMATRLNGGAIPSTQQMNQVALQLGKALNDPAKGLTMLTREGVTFTDQQKAQIIAMEQSGDKAGAQALMLKELQKEFGGSAAAAGHANGGLAILGASFDDMKEKVGQAVIPILAQLATKIAPLVTGFAQSLPGAIHTAENVFNDIKPPVSAVAGFIGNVKDRIGDLANVIRSQGPVIQGLEALFIGIATAITGKLIVSFIASIPQLVTQAALWIADAAATGAAAIASAAALAPFLAIGAAIGAVILIVKLAIDHWGQITASLGHFKDMLGHVKDTVLGFVSGPLHFFEDGIRGDIAIVGNILGILGRLKDFLTGALSSAWNGLGSLVSGIWSGISGAVKGGINDIIGIIDSMISKIDSIHIDLPSVGGIGGGHIGFNIPLIPKLASGGDISGPFIGGEGEGAELLTRPGLYNAPPGSHVYSASQTANLFAAAASGAHAANTGGIPEGTPLVVHVHVAGQHVAQAILPDIVDAIYRSAGMRGIGRGPVSLAH